MSFSRRGFLQLLGAGAGALALAPLLPSAPVPKRFWSGWGPGSLPYATQGLLVLGYDWQDRAGSVEETLQQVAPFEVHGTGYHRLLIDLHWEHRTNQTFVLTSEPLVFRNVTVCADGLVLVDRTGHVRSHHTFHRSVTAIAGDFTVNPATMGLFHLTQ